MKTKMSGTNQDTDMREAVHSEDIAKIKGLLKKGISDTDRQFLVRTAAIAGKFKSMKALVDGDEKHLDYIDALNGAAAYGQLHCLKYLFEVGADVNKLDPLGDTPLLSATRNGRYKCVELLIEQGANVNYMPVNNKSALILAAEKCELDLMKLLLLNGADVNGSGKYMNTPLLALTSKIVHRCKTDGDVCIHDTCLKLLIAKGADVNRCNALGKTPLKKSCAGNNVSFVKILLEAGADVNDAGNAARETALMVACETPSVECTKLLLEYGADVNAINVSDFNSLSIIRIYKKVFHALAYKRASKLLFAAGIDVEAQNNRAFLEQCLNDLDDLGEGQGEIEGPKTLKQICRVAIRSQLELNINGTNLFVLVRQLPLPSVIKDFLLYGCKSSH